MKKLLLFGFLTLGMGISLLAQVEIARESFEDSGGHGYTTYPSQQCLCCSGNNVAWYRKNATTNESCYGSTSDADGTYYWAAEHTDRINEELPGNPYADEVIVQLNNIDVSGHNNLEIRFLAGHGIMNEVENNDYCRIEYALDGDIASDNYTLAAEFFGWNVFNEELAYDSNADGLLDGDTLTQSFQEFVADLGTTTGSTLSVRFVFFADSFGEDISLDNIRVVGNQVPLPLDLQHFSLSEKDESLDINWTTLNEVNIANFHLQRSTDLSNWITINSQSAKGAGDYTFQDTNLPSAKTIYYRLQWLDFQGSTSYSPIRAFSPKSAFYVGALYPNPLTGNTVQVDIQTKRANPANWQLFNTLGQLQQSGTLSLKKGEERYHFDIGELPAGMYFWKVDMNGQVVSRRVVKK